MKTIRMMLVLVAVMAFGGPVQAQHGYPVQSVYDNGWKYILYSSGNIVRENGWGRRELIDNGTGSRMIAAGNSRCYVLKNNGNIWMWQNYNWRMIDNGTGTAEIWVNWNTVYCRKNNGRVWRCVNPYTMQWQPVGWRQDGREARFANLGE